MGGVVGQVDNPACNVSSSSHTHTHTHAHTQECPMNHYICKKIFSKKLFNFARKNNKVMNISFAKPLK